MASLPGPTSLMRPAPWRRFGPIRLGILVAAIAVVAGGPIAWRLSRPPESVGSFRLANAREPSGFAVNVSAPLVPVVAIHSGRLADQTAPTAGPRPVGIRLPDIGVRARVVPVGVRSDTGSMRIPADVDVVGWYRFGSVPGGPGSAVLVGHVDSAAQGAGAFFQLGKLDVGSAVVLRLKGGNHRRFRVVARRSYPKAQLPAAVFRRFGPPSLALITCGGSFDPTTRHYADNVVVYAVPANR